MQIRCYRCGWSFAIKKEEAAFALQALEETGGTHYDSNCPRCRHSNRISLEQLKKASPAAGTEPAASEPEEPAEVVEAEPELEAELVNPETNGQETQAKSEKPEPKKKRRKRG
jgi:phage FluMu protein Com